MGILKNNTGYLTVNRSDLVTALLAAFEQGRFAGLLIKDKAPVDIQERALKFAKLTIDKFKKDNEQRQSKNGN